MPKITFKATKMSEAKAEFISLVERGANRIPFKIIKQEKDMKGMAGLDLARIFKGDASKKSPAVVAIAAMKDEKLESVKEKLAQAGFTVEKMEEREDGSVVFKQEDFDGETIAIKMGDVVLVTKGFSPYSMELNSAEGTTFKEVCDAQGFYPGIRTAMEVLSDSVGSVLRVSANPAEASSSITKLFSEAQAYVRAMVSGLPTKAFKMEDAVVVTKQDPATEPTTGTASESGTEQETEQGNESAADTEGEGEGEVGKTVEKSEESSGQKLTGEEVSSIVAEKVGEAMSQMVEKMGEIGSALAAIQKTSQDQAEKVTSLAARLDEAERVAKSAKEAVSGVVVGGTTPADAAPVQKSETSGPLGEVDTAFNRNVRRKAI